jgi:hypothetical protein
MINNNISFGHIFVILLLAFTCLCVCLLPKDVSILEMGMSSPGL